MKILTNDAWRRQGSSIIFDAEELKKLLNEGAMVSLREFLAWDKNIPTDAPVHGQTVLVCGLEALMDTLPANEAQEFLSMKIRPLIRKLGNEWTNTGIVFGFSQGGQVFLESNGMAEEVTFKRKDVTQVQISMTLWGSTVALNMHRIEKRTDGQKITVGYYVARIS